VTAADQDEERFQAGGDALDSRGEAGRGPAEGRVDRAVGQRGLLRDRAPGNDEVDHDVTGLVEGADQVARRRVAGKRVDAQRAAAGREHARRLVGQADQGAGVRQEGGAVLGQPGPGPGAVQQRRAQVGFEPGDPLGHGLLGHPEAVRRVGEMTVVDDGEEGPDRAEIQLH
jgi:hypothetical protein